MAVLSYLTPPLNQPPGSNFGGILFPLILPPLIARFGIMKTTRIYAVTMAIGMVPAVLFMKARLPESRVHGPGPRASTGRRWLKDRNLWFFLSINTVQGFAHFVPLTWLPSECSMHATRHRSDRNITSIAYASALGLNAAQASLTLAVVNGSSVFSGSTMGYF